MYDHCTCVLHHARRVHQQQLTQNNDIYVRIVNMVEGHCYLVISNGVTNRAGNVRSIVSQNWDVFQLTKAGYVAETS